MIKIGEFDQNLTGYLETNISNALAQSNYTVFRNFPVDTTFENTVFEIVNCMVQIQYSEPNTWDVFKEAKVERIIQLSIEGQIYNSKDNKVLLPIKTSKYFSDPIYYDQIEELEQSPYPFTNGKKADISSWQKIIEPVIVVSSVLVVVLLLFTQRS